ncbi:MAG: S41 family peptidase [Planctomycetota bacterium]
MIPFPAVRRSLAPLVLILTLACAADRPAPVPETAPAAVPAPAEDPGARAITAEEAVADFETAWRAIAETYFDPTFHGLDWPGIRDELLPRAEAATTRREARAVIRDMLARLEQSHFSLLPAEFLPSAAGTAILGVGDDAETEASAAVAGGVGLDVRLRNGALLVTEVEADGPAAAAGVRTGWLLRRAGEVELDPLLAELASAEEELYPRLIAYAARDVFLDATYGEVGSKVELAFLDAADQEVVLSIPRALRDVVAHAASTTLPTFYLEFASEAIERDGKRFGRIHFTNWFLPMAYRIDEAVDAMRGGDGIVIDLRGNGGGVLAMCMGLAGHFFAAKVELGTMRFHDTTMRLAVTPRRLSRTGEPVAPFAGPVAILVDETSGSASEVFSGGMQSVGRARVFGETSVGGVLPARMTELPSGDALLHAMADFRTADGTLLEHRGVIPDEIVPLTREALLAGEDVVLEAALRWFAAAAH